MTSFQLRGNLNPLCFIGILLFVAVYTAEGKKEPKKIAKRYVTTSPLNNPSYYSYCESEASASQPPECMSTDNPPESGNCTCSPSACPVGATIRMCTSADRNITGCTIFTCICNGTSASPNYCVNVLPYPETAVVPYTPTPAGLDMGIGYGDGDGDFLALIIHQLKGDALSTSTNSDEKIMKAIVSAKIQHQQNIILSSSSTPNEKEVALVKLQKLEQKQLETPNEVKMMDTVSANQPLADDGAAQIVQEKIRALIQQQAGGLV